MLPSRPVPSAEPWLGAACLLGMMASLDLESIPPPPASFWTRSLRAVPSVSACGTEGSSDIDDGGLRLSWQGVESDRLSPSVQVRAPDLKGTRVRVDLRVSFGAGTVTRSSEEVEVQPMETVEFMLDLDDPALFFDEQQSDWLSSARATAVALDSDGAVIARTMAPMAWLAFDDGWPLLLNRDLVAERAPNGGFSEEAATLVTEAQARGDDAFVTWYGGLDG